MTDTAAEVAYGPGRVIRRTWDEADGGVTGCASRAANRSESANALSPLITRWRVSSQPAEGVAAEAGYW